MTAEKDHPEQGARTLERVKGLIQRGAVLKASHFKCSLKVPKVRKVTV